MHSRHFLHKLRSIVALSMYAGKSDEDDVLGSLETVTCGTVLYRLEGKLQVHRVPAILL